MPPDRTTPNEYRGIKRSQQACLNCRRKKAKCTGERPICAYCKRLDQDCQWTSSQYGGQRATPEILALDGSVGSEGGHSSGDEMLTRIASVEAKVDSLTALLTSYLPLLINQNQNVTPAFQPVPASSTGTSAHGSNHLTASSDELSFQHIVSQQATFKVLPPREVLDGLIDLYFERVQNQPYSFFHEQSFRNRVATSTLPDFLLFAVLASALRFSDDPYYGDAKNEAIKSYASESWKLIVSVWFGPECDPDIHICQAMTLLSIIDFTAGRRNPGWLKIGLAIRIAQSLHLMMEPSQSLDHSEQEERRRVFWSIYILDKLCSCGRARPSALADSHCSVQLPCDEVTFRNCEGKKTPTLEEAFSGPSTADSSIEQPSDLALVVLTASVLGQCAQHSIHQTLRGEKHLPPWDSKSLFASIYSTLLHLETKYELSNSVNEVIERECQSQGYVDMQLAGPVLFSKAIFRTCQCILHHPLLLHQQSRVTGTKAPPSFWNRAMQTCRENACSISEMFQTLSTSGHTAPYSFLGYCATVAGSIHALYLQDSNTGIRETASGYLKSDMDYVKRLSHQWKSGEWMVLILEKLVKQSPLSATLLTASPPWESFDKDQLENYWASIDYNTMSHAPVEAQPQTSTIRTPWDAFDNLDRFGTYPTITSQQHQAQASPSQSHGSYYDTMAFANMSPFTSFFNGGGPSFGG